MRAAMRWTGFLLLAVLLAGGCARGNALRVEQPFAPHSQRDMDLRSRWCWYAALDGRQALLLEFPLPASIRGFKAFRVYAEVPSGFGTYEIDTTRSGGARAFFVQEVGELQGKVVIRGGRIRVAPVAFAAGQRAVTLTLEGDNEFRITGRVVAGDNDLEVRRFLREYRPDVEALRSLHKGSPASQPVRPPATAPAPAPPPPAEPAPEASTNSEDAVESDAFLFEQEK